MAAVIWFTGPPASGKTTVARKVSEELRRRGLKVQSLDGDQIRRETGRTGFSRTQRDAHVLDVGDRAASLEREGFFAVVSLISPYSETRKRVRTRCDNFVEVYVATPLEVCRRRDPKGLYAKAKRGEIESFTGVQDPYEPPEAPELTLDTSVLTEGEAAARVMTWLESHLGVKGA